MFAENSTTFTVMGKLLGHVVDNVVSQPTTNGSFLPTSTSAWNHQNVTDPPAEYDSQPDVTSGAVIICMTGLAFSLVTRITVITCVVIGLFVVSLASYTIHRKCVKDGWKQQQHKSSLFL